MRSRGPLLAALAAAALAASCATSQVYVPAEQATRLARRLSGERRFLNVSMFTTPFFGDTTRQLLTPLAPDQVRLLENPDGSPVNPGPVQRTLPVGTPVRIVRLEFPTPATMAERVLYTPRSLLWVTVEVGGAPRHAPPLVLVLRPGLKSEDEVRTDLDRLLGIEDPTPRLEAFSEGVREAVRSKNALVDMPADALEMAWGPPQTRRIELVGPERRERWSWPGSRAATLVDGRVRELTGR